MRGRFLVACTKSVAREKKTYGYIERNQAKRQDFIKQLATVPRAQRVYVDEAGMDSRDEYSYGWNQRGERFHSLQTGRRTGRVNMIAAWCAQQLLAPFTIDGACNRVVFETWWKTCLMPVLQLLSGGDFR